ncbi:MAG: hypothetical protein WCA20_02195 [Candidatus Sulfotelmatobacter sp.]
MAGAVVFTEKKRVENLHYMHRHPEKRGVVLSRNCGLQRGVTTGTGSCAGG